MVLPEPACKPGVETSRKFLQELGLKSREIAPPRLQGRPGLDRPAPSPMVCLPGGLSSWPAGQGAAPPQGVPAAWEDRAQAESRKSHQDPSLLPLPMSQIKGVSKVTAPGCLSTEPEVPYKGVSGWFPTTREGPGKKPRTD